MIDWVLLGLVGGSLAAQVWIMIQARSMDRRVSEIEGIANELIDQSEALPPILQAILQAIEDASGVLERVDEPPNFIAQAIPTIIERLFQTPTAPQAEAWPDALPNPSPGDAASQA